MNGPIDIRTATLFNAAVGVIFWLYLAYVYRTRKTYAGFLQWTIAALCVSASMVLISLRDTIPAWATIVVGNALAITAQSLIDRGVTLFLDRKSSRWWLVLPVAAVVGISIFFTYAHPDIKARIILISLVLLVPLLHCLVVVRGAVADRPALSTGWLSGALGGLALWWLIRSVLTWLYEGENAGFLSTSIIQGFSLLFYAAGNIAIFLGLLVLHQQRIEAELKQAVEEVRTLRGSIPICSTCKKIRDDQGAWNQLEEYISRHSAAEFTHGYCPECLSKVLATLK